ncbi:MAG TPA: hypothetical protein VGP61_10385 [Gemmatimonadales bacterium]|nr:hypothetical protein [Gemmatimonadales bacterium]
MPREPNDSERDYDSDIEQDTENLEAVESQFELPSAETRERASRPKATGGQRTGSQSAERATGKARGKRPARRAGKRAAR